MKRTLITVLIVVIAVTSVYFSFNYLQVREKSREDRRTQTAPSPERITVRVYFSNKQKDPQALECDKVYPVQRQILKTRTVARATLRELLKGPTETEKKEGYFTNINSGVKVRTLEVEDGLARVDFNEKLEYQVGGSCRVQAIRAQIEETLRQFSNIDEVIISVNGRIEEVLQP